VSFASPIKIGLKMLVYTRLGRLGGKKWNECIRGWKEKARMATNERQARNGIVYAKDENRRVALEIRTH